MDNVTDSELKDIRESIWQQLNNQAEKLDRLINCWWCKYYFIHQSQSNSLSTLSTWVDSFGSSRGWKGFRDNAAAWGE